MPSESLAPAALPGAPQGRRTLLTEAASLLVRAAAPDRRHLWIAVAWLLLAAGLEALGPSSARP